MTMSRRRFVLTSGLLITGAFGALRQGHGADMIDIAMEGTTGGAHVWFRPAGLLIEPGQSVRWTNKDAGNSHTSTCYHPTLFGKPQRIPKGAAPWDSGFLLPDESFTVTFTVPGVYDYYCLPHELAGMVGRIIVGSPEPAGWEEPASPSAGLAGNILQRFPPTELIMKNKSVDAM